MPNKTREIEELYLQSQQVNLQQVARLTSRDHLFGNLRLAVAAVFVLLLLGSVFASWCSLYCLTIPAAIFVILAVYHSEIAKRRHNAERVVAFYKRGLDRLNGHWQGSGINGSGFTTLAPLYGHDLDIFGSGSLYELLCNSRTNTGRALLAKWIVETPLVDEINARQHAVRTLTPLTQTREALWKCGHNPSKSIDVTRLIRWGDSATVPVSVFQITFATILVCLFLIRIFMLLHNDNITVLVLIGMASLLFQRFSAGRLLHVSAEVAKRDTDIDAILEIATAISEAEFAGSEKLEAIRLSLSSAIAPLAKLKKLVAFRQISSNQAAIVIGAVFQIPFFSASAIERWHAKHIGKLAEWTDAISEFEVLLDLSTFAFENPNYVFPRIEPSGVQFNAVNLAHPLLAHNAVGNSVSLDENTKLLVLSGSNMSGKSTLMRAVGVNVILGMTGAPVRADQCTMTLLAPSASISTQDSLMEGVSRFYAEILRLSKIVELSESQTCLFLLDEILSGTNSFARQIGAQSIVSKLVSNGSIGIITTHDLALEHIVDNVPTAKNVHLDDQIIDGKLAFDYILKPGFVTTSNAIELMRAVGLDVS